MGVKGVRAIRCPHLCCQLMPGHCKGSLVSVPNLLGRCCRCPAGKRNWQKGQKAGKKEKTEEVNCARVLVRVSTDSRLHPLASSPLGGYRLTAIRLNLFHHKRLNKEVHSSGAATAADHPSLVPFRRLLLSDTVHHLRSSIWISFFSKAESPKLRDSDASYCSLDFFAIQLYRFALINRRQSVEPMTKFKGSN